MKRIVIAILFIFVLVMTGCRADLSESDPPATNTPTEAASAEPDDTPPVSEPSDETTIANNETSSPDQEEPTPGQTVPEIPSLQLQEAFPNLLFEQPLYLLHANDQSDRVFVVERTGKVRVMRNSPDAETAETFINMDSRIDTSASEKGLLGMAFHPLYEENGLFYLYYTNRTHSVISAFSTDPDDPDKALLDSERVILEFFQPYSNHNGGHLAFGPDGYLYIASGDGGSRGDPDGNAQDLENLLGKILRIDVDVDDSSQPYQIPPDNPFVANTAGIRPEIYAYGLRNPWRFSFDQQRGWLIAADVGQNRVEEINLIESGGNYGWNIMEGSLCYPENSNCDPEGLILPVWEYFHPTGRSVTGGYVYYGEKHPYLEGLYIYADFITGLVWALRLDNLSEPENKLLLETSLNISSFGLDQQNEIYLVDYNGKIYTLSP